MANVNIKTLDPAVFLNSVGIGTVSPSTRLEVQSANPTIRVKANTDNWAALDIHAGDTQACYLFMRDSSGERARILSTNNNDLRFRTGGGTVDGLNINSVGSVGVNTTSPNLGSWGRTLTINSDSTGSSCSLELAQGGTLYGFIGVQGSGSSNALDIAAYQSQDIRFRVGASGGTQAIVIDSSATTRANGDLILANVSTTTDAGNTLAFHTTTAGWSTANAHATISGKRTDASNGYLTFSTRGSGTTTERMRIDSSGRVGISESPSDITVTSLNQFVVGTPAIGMSSGNAGIVIGSSNSGSGAISFLDNTDTSIAGRIEYDHSDDALKFNVNSSERMRIDSAGRIIIASLPTSDPGIAGALYRDGSNVKVSV